MSRQEGRSWLDRLAIRQRMRGEAVGSTSGPRAALPRGVWTLGFVSMFMDISSEMIHGLLPTFLVVVLGASAEMVGLIEGVGEATASMTKLFSGFVSDRFGKRKALALIGYGLAALSKPLFALAPTAAWVLGARFIDRIGKGVRDAPRDALVGDLTPSGLRGAAYGLRQSLDTIGAFSGPLLAIALMAMFNNDFRLVFWLATIPGLAAVGVLAVGVREPVRPPVEMKAALGWVDLRRFGASFWGVVAIGSVLTLARFSEAFLILRAGGAGLPAALSPLVLVVMNVVYAASAYPIGALSDRSDRRLMLAVGFAVLIVADLVLTAAPTLWAVLIGVGLWGLHMGMTQGLLAALVADSAPSELRASAFGLFNFASGVELLFASLVAGFLWQRVGPEATFLAGAGFTAIGLLGSARLLKPAGQSS
ncbi:MAG TPA: MFS transporter [Roseiarcus sp.]|nr:MFS transporter [Roseiarcus sp.]